MLKPSRELIGTDLTKIGGKAKGLLWLQRYGFAVPDFSVIDSDRVAKWLHTSEIYTGNDFLKKKDILLNNIKQDCRSLPSQTWESVAVRSSGISEDSTFDSFAGVHESVLCVCGFDEATTAILKVIESAFSDIAIQYRKSRNLSTTEIEIAIIVQKMVPAVLSGVAFGLDLQTGSQKSTWISLTEGLGDKLVSGQVDGCEVLCNQTELNLLRGSYNKKFKQVILDVAKKTQEASRIKRHPQDLEWAFDGQTLWLTQMRPVTTDVVDKDLPVTVFDNSNIQESYCGVTTPLTFTYASRAYFLVYKQLMRLMNMSEEEISQATWNLHNMLGLVNGRVYYNINNWYAGLLYFPSFGKRKDEMENMMGLEKPVEFVQNFELSFKQKMVRVPRMIKLLVMMVYRFSRMNSLVKEFDQWFWDLYKQADIEGIYRLNEFEIFEKIRIFQDLFLEKWSIPVLNDTKVMLEMGSVKRSLTKLGLQDELQTLLYGAEIESIRPSLEIHRLSKLFGSQDRLRNLIMQKRGTEIETELEIFFPDVYAEVRKFISLYGDRTMGELKLETITARQDSEQLLVIIRSYIEAKLHLKPSLFEDGLPKSESILKNVNPIRRILLNRKVNQLKKSMADREKMRLHRTRNFGLMRELYLALGKKWETRQLLEDKRDIFYLTHQEIFEIGSGRSSTINLKKLVQLRRQDFDKVESQFTPNQISIPFPSSHHQVQEMATVKNAESQFKGLGCSQGVCEGEILFVTNPTDVKDLGGKILLAERTDPGWTPLFAMVKGVIIEKGSMLSHSAVIAREMGIPSVLGIQDVTRQIQSGDFVRMDGVHGTVEIIKRRKQSSVSNPSADISF